MNGNGGIRAATTPGYDASRDYVRSELEAAGYTVTLDEFIINRFANDGSSSSVSWEGQPSYVEGDDFHVAGAAAHVIEAYAK